MSILIKDMRMPDRCIDCPMKNFEDDCVVQEHSDHWNSWEDMRKGCPLVEIPTPHGRLVDIDAEIEKHDRVPILGEHLKVMAKHMTTVIEGED